MENSTNNKIIEQVILQSWSEDISDHFAIEVALSGGLDSVVLLHALQQLRQHHPFELSAIHIHHGLQAVADDWVKFCQDLCQQWAVPLTVCYAQINLNSPLGIEGAAREARYQFFKHSDKKIIALAHHHNDQIETFLLSMLRGGGLRGLVSMAVTHPIDKEHTVWRPLLKISRNQLEQYAQEQQLSFVTDPSNKDTQYLRNWVRHDLVPMLQHKDKHFSAHIERNIINFQEVLSILDEVVLSDWETVNIHGRIDCDVWLSLSESRRKEVLKYFCAVHQLGTPRTQSINTFAQQLARNIHSAHQWQLPDGVAYVYQKQLWAWSNHGQLYQKLSSQSWLKEDIKWVKAKKGLSKEYISQKWQVRAMKKCDTIYTNVGRKKVDKLLQEKKIPPFLRYWWPVMVNEKNEVEVVLGYRIDSRLECVDGYVPKIEILVKYFFELNI